MAQNPFDQFDAKPASSGGNPFDQFDSPKTSSTSAPHESALHHWAGLTGRALTNGVTGLADMFSHAGDTDLAQASAVRPELADVKPTPVSEQAESALDRAGVARPQGVGEQLYSGAVSALPGAALGGAAGALTRLGTGAASGAASTGAGIAAHAAGASPSQQAAVELATGLAVPGGLAAGAKAADARALARVPADRAPVTASVIAGIDAHHASTLNGGPWANSAASYTKDGAETLNGLADALHKNAIISAAQRKTIVNAVGQAAAHQNRLSTAPGSAYDTISQMQNVPPSVRDALLGGLDHLDTASSNKLLRNSKGPLEKVGATAGGLIPLFGHHTALGMLDAPPGVVIGGAIGRGLDNRLGLAKAPAQRLSSAAQRVLGITGQAQGENPLDKVRGIAGGLNEADPEMLFEASSGDLGSPIREPQNIDFGSPQVPEPNTGPRPQPSPQAPLSVPQSPATPAGFQPELRGGQVLINHKLTDQRLPPALHSEITSAVQQGLTSGLPQSAADAILAGQNTDGYTARYLARMVHHQRTGAERPEDYDASAADAVSRAFASVPELPNGPSNMGRPIDNYHRWAGAARSYQSAVDGAAQAASAAGHHEVAARMQDLKVLPKTEAKQGLYQELLAKHPEAASFISSQLLKGID